jgi:hypothetical protein
METGAREMKPTQTVELEWKLVSEYAAQFLEGAYYWCIDGRAIKKKLGPVICRFMSGSFVYNNTNIYAYKFIGPIEVPSFPEPQQKLLTYPEALRVVLDGGIVEGLGTRKFPHDINMLWEMFKADDDMSTIYGKECWKIIKPAPKPKMPDELRGFKKFLYSNVVYGLTDVGAIFDKGDVFLSRNNLLEKLKPLLELYAEE